MSVIDWQQAGHSTCHYPPIMVVQLPNTFLRFFFVSCLLLVPSTGLLGQSIDGPGTDSEPLPERFAQWLDETSVLMSRIEKSLFLSLSKDYQREAFIQQFWKVRDPYPRSARNELKERWPERLAIARSRFGGLNDDRSRILMLHGEAHSKVEIKCTKKNIPVEAWGYQGSDFVDSPFLVVFYKPHSRAEARLWRPSFGSVGFNQLLSRVRGCLNGNILMQTITSIRTNADAYDALLARVLAKPRPRSLEWVHTFVALSTDLASDSELIAGVDVGFSFLGRHQNRTVVQGVVNLPSTEVAIGEFAGYRSRELYLTGEVIVDNSLFESFRYRFGFPEEESPGQIPLAFQRYLRPGSYTVILKVEDLSSHRVARIERQIQVPIADEAWARPTFHDPRTEQLFAEATEAIAAGETSLRLIVPIGEMLAGFVRFDTLITGDEIEKVMFFLDDTKVLTKNRAPFNVEVDLGTHPTLHTLRAVALDGEGREVATDEVLLNAGGYRFFVKLREPQKGKTYSNSLRARVEVEVPDGRTLDRVEIFLNETKMATLYQEPFVQPIALPSSLDLAYVRAVAYLPDGNSTEDLVFINAPDYLEEVEIQFVELYTTVLDQQGRPVEGLLESDFSVLEDGISQSISRFERVESLPIHVGILIDNSASMVGTLDEARKAALSFFEQAIHSKDRAAVITFNSFPHLAVELTSDRRQLGSGLAGLRAEGQTALFDSVMFGLYYFTGIKGQRALLVLSDGKDESSRFDFEDTLEYARRAGITIYTIGLRLHDAGARNKLSRLADETGGRSFFIPNINELENIYSTIQEELRAQYLIAYQSSNSSEEDNFRVVDLKIAKPKLTVKTLSGYYP